MAVFVSNIVIEQGFDFNTNFILEDVSTTNFLNLSGYTVESKLRKTYTSSNSVSFDSSIVNATGGEVRISLASTETSNLKSGRYVYDVKATNGSDIFKLVEGTALVRPGVTR